MIAVRRLATSPIRDAPASAPISSAQAPAALINVFACEVFFRVETVQAQIISLLEQLRDEFGLTYLFISHDLSLVQYFCDEILVMYLGRVVEALPDTKSPARHPYTATLMESTFAPDPKQRRVIAPLEGEVPSPFNLPPGCAFADRCPRASAICRSETPTLSAVGGHAVACHHPL